MLKQLIFRDFFHVLVDTLQVCTEGHHSLLRLKKALSLSLIKDIIVIDGRTAMKAKNTIMTGAELAHNIKKQKKLRLGKIPTISFLFIIYFYICNIVFVVSF